MIPLYKVRMQSEVDQKVLDALHSGYVGQGNRVKEFEQEFGKWIQVDETQSVVATNSCTSALHLAFHMVSAPKTEVLASPLTCFAGISAILANNLTIRWVDVDPETGCMDVEDLSRSISPDTTAVYVTDFCGIPADMEGIYACLGDRNIAVIEDCAHAFGSQRLGQRCVGSRLECENVKQPTIKCFSFQATKLITTGDGGALVLDHDLADRARLLRWYGIDRDEDRYSQNVKESGFKFHMNDVAASIGLGNLDGDLNEVMIRQKWIHNYFKTQLHNDITVMCSREREVNGMRQGDSSICSVLPLRMRNPRAFEAYMRESGIMSELPHNTCNKHECVREFCCENLPGVNSLLSELTAIPAGWWLHDDHLTYMVEKINEYYYSHGGVE